MICYISNVKQMTCGVLVVQGHWTMVRLRQQCYLDCVNVDEDIEDMKDIWSD